MNPTGDVTMADVGARAGVTARTVSNVLSGSTHVRPETRDRVLRAVDDLGYRINTAARSLKTGRTGSITLAIPDLGIDYFADLAHRIMAQAERRGWGVVIEQTGARRDRELSILSGAQRQHSDGLIFQPHALGPGDEKFLVGNDRLVILGDRIFHGPVDHVTMANTAAARTATRYLVDRGYTRIAAIGSNPKVHSVSAASLRLEGYCDALTTSGLPVRPEYVVPAEEWHLRDGAAAMAQLLALPERPDAVFCFNDTLAFGALQAAFAAGLSTPRDIAVMGFDNVPMAEFSIPPLTTIEPGTGEIARLAVDLLAARIEGRSGTPAELVTSFSLIARQSA
ncbi:LacI family DNA-binding transcriptional regulator [Rathayibacter sp. Leaf248]|uniref:LacI family DNA-binding transcriptional regulator n=1 Tax=Rathayibacter sp. Leaf248 TaxID=2876555 RepID=UPI001E4C8FC1|nr:LacI family DNA-binding transcriptional regulator [Rathayibacter sp. Leaf248]